MDKLVSTIANFFKTRLCGVSSIQIPVNIVTIDMIICE